MSDSATPWTAADQSFLTFTNSRSLFKLISIKSVMPSNHLILCHPLLFLPSNFASITVFLSLFIFTLQYCIGFSIHQHESAMGVHVFPILNPPPTSLPIPSLWVIPVHHPQASCILLQTWTGNSFLIWYYTYFNAILPNHPPTPSPTESKRLFYTSASLLLSRIQGYHYHLSKFHIYGLVCCIDVFLSGLLHCIIGSSFIHLIRTDSNVFFLMAE